MNDKPYWMRARGEMVHPQERLLLYRLAEIVAHHFDNPNIINIGVSWGASVHCLHAGAPQANITAIDTNYQKRPVQQLDRIDESKVNFVMADSKSLKFDDDCHLVFVDGDHTYGGVKGDIDNWVPRIPVGGIIAFHDYQPQERDEKRLEGVKRAVNEWHKGKEVEWLVIEKKDSIIVFRRVL